MRPAPLVLALAFALPAVAQEVPEGSVAHYRCDGGGSLAAAYLNPPGGDSYAVVVWDGRMTPMKAGLTGSGVRYLALDGSDLVWHTKGDEGFLAHDTDMAMIAEGCTAADG
jgi:membrane-bound inhibitor of C-type lysozyme